MEKKQHSVEEIIREVEGGQTVTQVCQSHNISEQTYYRWKQKYGGMDLSEAKRLKRKIADLVIENDRHTQRGELKKVVGPSPKRRAIKGVIEESEVSVRRACKAIYLYKSY